MRMLTRDPDPQVRRIMLFQRTIPLACVIVGLPAWLVHFLGNGRSPWSSLATEVFTVVTAVLVCSFAIALVLNLRRSKRNGG